MGDLTGRLHELEVGFARLEATLNGRVDTMEANLTAALERFSKESADRNAEAARQYAAAARQYAAAADRDAAAADRAAEMSDRLATAAERMATTRWWETAVLIAAIGLFAAITSGGLAELMAVFFPGGERS